MEDWTTIKEELYANEKDKLVDTAHALARGKQTSTGKDGKEHIDDDVCVWTNTYNGKTRVFGTTLGHNNETCTDAEVPRPADSRPAMVRRQARRCSHEARRQGAAGPAGGRRKVNARPPRHPSDQRRARTHADAIAAMRACPI